MESEPVLLGPSISAHFVGLLKQGDPAEPSSPEVRPGSTSEASITHNEEPSLRKPFQISFKNLDGAVKDWKPRTFVNYGESPSTPTETSAPVEIRYSCDSSPSGRTRGSTRSHVSSFKSRITPRSRRQVPNIQSLFDPNNLNFAVTDLALLTIPKVDVTVSQVEIPFVKALDSDSESSPASDSDDELDDSLYIALHCPRELLERKRYQHPNAQLDSILQKPQKITQNMESYYQTAQYLSWESLSHLAGFQASRPPPCTRSTRNKSSFSPGFAKRTNDSSFSESTPKKQKRKGRPPKSLSHGNPIDWFGFSPHPVLRDLKWSVESRPSEFDALTQRPRLVLYLRKRQ